VNVVLAFWIAVLAGIWVNFVTGNNTDVPWTRHLYLAGALLLLLLQAWYNMNTTKIERRAIFQLLDVGIRFLVSHSKDGAQVADLRGVVHLIESAKPGPKLARQACLVPRYWRCDISFMPDRGVIPLANDNCRAWYVNVRAFDSQSAIAEQPDLSKRPTDQDFYIKPSLFKGKSVLSVPIPASLESHPFVGTLTFDSKVEISKLDWLDANGAVVQPVDSFITMLSGLIGKIVTNEQD